MWNTSGEENCWLLEINFWPHTVINFNFQRNSFPKFMRENYWMWKSFHFIGMWSVGLKMLKKWYTGVRSPLAGRRALSSCSRQTTHQATQRSSAPRMTQQNAGIWVIALSGGAGYSIQKRFSHDSCHQLLPPASPQLIKRHVMRHFPFLIVEFIQF